MPLKNTVPKKSKEASSAMPPADLKDVAAGLEPSHQVCAAAVTATVSATVLAAVTAPVSLAFNSNCQSNR